MSRPRVYLAGPITGLSYGGATDWRIKAMNTLEVWGIDALSPMRAKTYLKDEKSIDGSADAYQRVHAISTPKGICTRDRNDTMRVDAVLMNLLGAEKVSIGSMIEIGWADAARVPLVVVMEPDREETVPVVVGPGFEPHRFETRKIVNPHSHTMVNHLAGYIVPTLNEGLDIVKALLLP